MGVLRRPAAAEAEGLPLHASPSRARWCSPNSRTCASAGSTSGTSVGLKLNKSGTTDATIEIDSKYAPIRANTHAILRVKTLLGETYVQLIPQAQNGPSLADNGHLADANVEPTVTLDDILASLDKPTRQYFQVWQQSVAVGIHGRGEQINSDFAVLEPFVEHTNQLLQHPRLPGRGAARGRQEHRRRVQRARRAATTSSKS